ncbi:MAG: hypothetical protein ACHQAZ_00425 [Gammaproteobacteria bacterium]
MEIGLSLRGIHPSLLDSSRLWQKERGRADDLGASALALVGSSRILLDMDLTTLRHETGLQPVQLAIEGSSFMPVLAGLANDQAFTGSVIVELDEKFMAVPLQYDAAFAYQSDYERSRRQPLTDYQTVEDYLSEKLHGQLRSYADGTRPITALLKRILMKPDPVQYLETLPDREVLADYLKAPMPYLYYFRSLRTLDGSSDLPHGLSYRQIDAKIKAGIETLKPVDDVRFLDTLPVVNAMVQSIQARGGQVFFVKFPESGYVEEIDDRLYPRRQFWDLFASGAGGQNLNFEDDPVLKRFICPDGSHLDYRQRASFTDALVNTLHLRQKADIHGR